MATSNSTSDDLPYQFLASTAGPPKAGAPLDRAASYFRLAEKEKEPPFGCDSPRSLYSPAPAGTLLTRGRRLLLASLFLVLLAISLTVTALYLQSIGSRNDASTGPTTATVVVKDVGFRMDWKNDGTTVSSTSPASLSASTGSSGVLLSTQSTASSDSSSASSSASASTASSSASSLPSSTLTSTDTTSGYWATSSGETNTTSSSSSVSATTTSRDVLVSSAVSSRCGGKAAWATVLGVLLVAWIA
ncbi:hypothetical protein DFJ73DRAFT_828739 [Zopfochytrium polystomum]|nr:hypothetical protein DFJ73DRAFT_828739 [Zopfochytrium polystomum]